MKNDIINLRQQVLNEGAGLLQISFERVRKGINPFSTKGEEKVFDLLAKMVAEADAPVNFDFSGDTIGEKVTSVLVAVADGKLTPNQGNKVMDIILSGFQITEVMQLRQLMEANGMLKVTE